MNPLTPTSKQYEYLNSKTHLSMPHVFGPGRWDILHSYAKMCQTVEQKKQFAKFVEEVFLPTIKCKECQTHFRNTLNEYPVPFGEKKFNDFIDWTNDDSPFKWAWKVHNIVNQRLNKPQLSFETCLLLYDINSETCQQCYKPMS